MLKIALRLVRICFFSLKKGISRLLSWIAPKYITATKGLKLKVRKFWWLIPTFTEIKWKKLLGGRLFESLPHPK